MEERPFTHASFQHYLREGRLMGARCESCGALHLPPRPMCARCFGSDMRWFPFSGAGRLAGFTVIHVGLPVMAAEGYSRDKPYASGIVRLAEGPAISARIVGAAPDALRVGMEVEAVFPQHRDGQDQRVVFGFAPKARA